MTTYDQKVNQPPASVREALDEIRGLTAFNDAIIAEITEANEAVRKGEKKDDRDFRVWKGEKQRTIDSAGRRIAALSEWVERERQKHLRDEPATIAKARDELREVRPQVSAVRATSDHVGCGSERTSLIATRRWLSARVEFLAEWLEQESSPLLAGEFTFNQAEPTSPATAKVEQESIARELQVIQRQVLEADKQERRRFREQIASSLARRDFLQSWIEKRHAHEKEAAAAVREA